MSTEDDLGEDGGRVFLSHAGEARGVVESWHPVAVGRRPKDFIARDLLFESLSRDARLWKWRKLLKHRPRWTYDGTFGQSEFERKQIAIFRGFQFLHLEHLARIAEELDEDSRAVLLKVWNCWPTTLQVAWVGEGQKTSRDVCDQAWHCPFCFARNIVDLHDRIQRGPWSHPDEKHLVLATAVVAPELVDLSDDCSDRDVMTSIRQQFGGRLRHVAAEFGVVGGVLIVQPGPALHRGVFEAEDRAEAGLEFRVALLGEVPASERRKLLALKQAGGKEFIYEQFRFSGGDLPTDWNVGSGRRPGTLRKLLVGTSHSYCGSLAGIAGAFIWPSWILANAAQWQRHRELVAGMRMFDAFGTWRGALAESERHRSFPKFFPQRTRLVRHANSSLMALNACRHSEAQSRREALLDELAPIWDQLIGAAGSSPGHGRLRNAAAACGIQISERDARWITSEFRSAEV